MKLFVKLRDTNAQLPERKHGSAGYDVRSVEEVEILPGKRATVSTGLSISFPAGHYCRIAPRSGLAHKHGIDVFAGVVDVDYRGIIKVILFNSDENETLKISIGDRIAQLIFEKISVFEVEEVSELEDTIRGEGGFGSTGHN